MAYSQLPAIIRQANYYGIQLWESEFRSWRDLSPSTSQLVFNWENINVGIHDQKQNIQIAVAQYFPKDERGTIKNMAAAVRQTKEIGKNDRIFGVEGQNIKKVGFITDKDVVFDQRVTLTIDWLQDQNLGEMEKPIFYEDAELQPLGYRDVNSIAQQLGAKFLSLMHQMPVREDSEYNNYQEGYKQGYEKIPPESNEFIKGVLEEQPQAIPYKIEKGGAVTLFYGTNRDRIGVHGTIQQYGDQETTELKYGICEVNIPRGHEQGQVERPGMFARLFNLPENKARHYVINETSELSETEFFDDFGRCLTDSANRHGLLFVHGFRTTFEEAAYRSAQLAWDIPFKGYTGFFSWPSAGKLINYAADSAAARSSAPLLSKFISQISNIPELEQLHIIAHSMGGLILTLALKEIYSNPSYLTQTAKIIELILGAPDIDRNEFRHTILPIFSQVGRQRTLYASDHDKALMLSDRIRRNRGRLGQIDGDIFVENGLDSVDASNLETGDNHGYLFDGKEVLSDLFYLLTKGFPPEDRRLREIQNSPINHWLFPK